MLEWLHFPWGRSDFDNLDSLESSLENAFRPVEPSPEFVRDLRYRLVNFPVPATSSQDSKVPIYIALTIASLLSGVAIVGIVVWIILALVGRYQEHDRGVTPSSNLAA
jgi:hypothetical protein